MRHKLAWILRTLPGICPLENMMYQIMETLFDCKYAIMINKALQTKLKRNYHTLQYHALDLSSLRLILRSDGLFTNNSDLQCQLGLIILPADKSDKENILSHGSYESKRVEQTVLGAETYALADYFDSALTLKEELQRASSRTVPMSLLTDCT